jgi:hypothetical protein
MAHHRVALALERSADYIDAEVTRLLTNYEIGPDVDVRQLVHTVADLFLWVYQWRGALRVIKPEADFAVAARDARRQRVSWRFRRQFMREKSSPLRPRE